MLRFSNFCIFMVPFINISICTYICMYRNITQKVLVSQHWDTSQLKLLILRFKWTVAMHIYGLPMSRDTELLFLNRCPDLSKIENANIFFSHKSRKIFTKYDTLGTVSHLFSNSKFKEIKSGFWNILTFIQKIQNGHLKIKNSNPSTIHKFYFYLVRRDPIIGSMD